MQAGTSTYALASTILDDCHRLVLTHLHALMNTMFENSDTAFKEFVDKAQSNNSQIRFMEAMHIVKKNRPQVEEIFYRYLGNTFKDFGNPQYAARPAATERTEPLTLVSKVDSDIQVALQNMASGAALGSTEALYALRQRLAVLNNGRKLDENQVPAGPTCLANAFHQAAQELVLDRESGLVVYMLFDKFVLSRTQPLYDEYNERLLKAGLLPNLKYDVRENNPASAQERMGGRSGIDSEAAHGDTDSVNAMGGSESQSLGDELFNNILQLLTRRDRQTHIPAGGSGQAAVYNPVPQTEIVSAIHQLQRRRLSDRAETVGNVKANTGSGHDKQVVNTMLAQLSEEREQLFTGIDRRRMPSADIHVIDLVGMMFEYMLNDEDLPSVAKAELSRLHTIYLKVGIIDKTLFSNSKHPAHELLNTLASAGTKWVFESDLSRGIFPTMRMVIQRIIEEYDSNIEIFGELLELCRRNLRDLEKRAAAIEERTRQAAVGKEKLELARTCATSAIESRVTGRNVPGELRKILGDALLDKLMFIYLREPESESSTAWSLAIQTIENIVWSVEPRRTDTAREELREKLPILRKTIERAFKMLDGYGASDNAVPLALIHELQDAALLGPVKESPEQTPAADHDVVNKDTVAIKPASADTGPVEQGAPYRQPAAQETPVPADGKQKTSTNEKRLSPEVKQALARLDELAFGTWFWFNENEDASPVRLKLSWFSQMSGNYMFVDSMGIKAAVKHRVELATLLASSKVRIISNGKQSFIKRALEAIRRMLSGDEQATA